MVDVTIATNARDVERKIVRIQTRITRQVPRLMRILSRVLRDDVKKRIATKDGGSWAPISKWGRAKGKNRALSGAGVFVKARVVGQQGQVYAETPQNKEGQNWSLTQHHKGFVNDVRPGSIVIIPLKRPGALGLPRNRRTFAFIERRAGKTPARKIWPGRDQAFALMRPLTLKWLKDATAP